MNYINDKYQKAISTWRQVDRNSDIDFQEKISYRLKQLGRSGLLPDIKVKIETRDGSEGFRAIIGKGILQEFYDQKITHDQLPNFKQLADYIIGKDETGSLSTTNRYRQDSDGRMVIDVDCKRLFEYFGDND